MGHCMGLRIGVQEQENQKRQLCEELEQLKSPQDSREASCQTPAPEEETGEDLDWDEEFALQDFLKNELAERNCRAQHGQTDGRQEEAADKVAGRGEEEDGEEKWTVVDRAGEGGVRDTSTPMSTLSREAQPGKGTMGGSQDSTACTESEPEVNCQSLQEEAPVPLCAHSQTVNIRHPEADAHSENYNAENRAVTQSPGNTRPMAAEMIPQDSPSPGPDDTQRESIQVTSEDHRREEKDGEADSSRADMIRTKSLIREKSVDRSAAEDSTSLLPVLLEEEESVQESTADSPAAAASMAGTDRPTSSGATSLSDSSSPQSRSSVINASQSGVGSVTSDPSQLEDSASAAKKDSLPHRGKNKNELELSHSIEAIEQHKAQEDQSGTNMTTEKELAEMSKISDCSDSVKEERNSLSPNDKEIETEFQRLALGFKCDMFTLEKRLRLEERSRDLAEDNVRREVSSCQGLLQALTPLCEDDNQSMEIIQRLQKNLDILIQSMTRVSSRSEMLGAIHQESRIGKAVEVMIQHVENLRRMYTKEHAELLELRETLMQNERSFGSSTERDDFRKKPPTSQYYKSSSRRVSIAAIPRSGGGNMHFDTTKTQDGSDADTERLTRRSPWNVAGKSSARPPLKRFVSSAAWVDTEEPSVMMKGTARGYQSEDEQKEKRVEEKRRSSLSELGSKLTSLILPSKTPSLSSSPRSTDSGMDPHLSHSLTTSHSTAAAVTRGSRGLWLWLAMVVVLAGLLALLASLVMQPAADAAPVGTGDSWMTIQQLLWPYTGLRHNGQPPV